MEQPQEIVKAPAILRYVEAVAAASTAPGYRAMHIAREEKFLHAAIHEQARGGARDCCNGGVSEGGRIVRRHRGGRCPVHTSAAYSLRSIARRVHYRFRTLRDPRIVNWKRQGRKRRDEAPMCFPVLTACRQQVCSQRRSRIAGKQARRAVSSARKNVS